MERVKHFITLLKEFVRFARQHKSWWILPVVLVLLLLAFLIVAGSSVAPFIYPLF
ncbi:MAG TPA: DUF5989 family protein [Verrucomicrobiae bacterium]|nr:DUF5989 family protein [Verrucomicrobiae bacterium]